MQRHVYAKQALFHWDLTSGFNSILKHLGILQLQREPHKIKVSWGQLSTKTKLWTLNTCFRRVIPGSVGSLMKALALPSTLDKTERFLDISSDRKTWHYSSFWDSYDQLLNEFSKPIYSDFLSIENLLFSWHIRNIWKHTHMHKHTHICIQKHRCISTYLWIHTQGICLISPPQGFSFLGLWWSIARRKGNIGHLGGTLFERLILSDTITKL